MIRSKRILTMPQQQQQQTLADISLSAWEKPGVGVVCGTPFVVCSIIRISHGIEKKLWSKINPRKISKQFGGSKV